MLERKFSKNIEQFLKTQPNKILLVNGARQIGKSYLIRYIGKKMFRNYVEINLKEDKEGKMIFAKVKSVDDFYLQLSALFGKNLKNKNNTLVFLDEIQSYPHLLTMLKFLCQDGKYTYIASGSQLGVALSETPSVPIGSISVKQMYPLDFEEFLWAMGCSVDVIEFAKKRFENNEALDEPLHDYFIRQLKNYLLVGGMPEAINQFLESRNILIVRTIQNDIHKLYQIDASQYDNERKLLIRRIYELIPSNLENKKKRVVVKNIENTGKHKQFNDYALEFEYLINSGIAIGVNAISNPKFPLLESSQKNFLKLYLNDIGILTGLLYNTNINAILNDEKSLNLGTVYESVVAQELNAHGFPLHYYDNKQKGEVDFLIDDYKNLTVLPLEIKSGKDYTKHSALDKFMHTSDYHIKKAVVLSNEREVFAKDATVYMPIYYVMFFEYRKDETESLIIPEIKLPEF